MSALQQAKRMNGDIRAILAQSVRLALAGEVNVVRSWPIPLDARYVERHVKLEGINQQLTSEVWAAVDSQDEVVLRKLRAFAQRG